MLGNNDNVPALSVNRRKDLIDEFMIVFPRGHLDLEIVCGQYRWPVHSEILKAGSGYFRNMFKNRSLENARNNIDLINQNPWDIARMMQFIYAGDYAADDFSGVFDEQDGRTMPSSTRLMGVAYTSRLSDGRQRQQIHHAMFYIGQYFEIPTLQERVANNMIDGLLPKGQLLGLHALSGGDIRAAYPKFLHSLEAHTRRFIEVYDFLLPYIDRSGEEKDQIEARLVNHVLFLKYGALGKHKSERPNIPILREMRELDQDNRYNANVKHLNSVIRGYALKNARFALKIAERFEYCLDADAVPSRWRFDAWRACQEYNESR